MAGAVAAPCTIESAPRASRDMDESVIPSLVSLGKHPGVPGPKEKCLFFPARPHSLKP